MKKLTVIFCLFATVALGQRVLNLSTTIRNQLIAQGLDQNNSGNIDVFEVENAQDVTLNINSITNEIRTNFSSLDTFVNQNSDWHIVHTNFIPDGNNNRVINDLSWAMR